MEGKKWFAYHKHLLGMQCRKDIILQNDFINTRSKNKNSTFYSKYASKFKANQMRMAYLLGFCITFQLSPIYDCTIDIKQIYLNQKYTINYLLMFLIAKSYQPSNNLIKSNLNMIKMGQDQLIISWIYKNNFLLKKQHLVYYLIEYLNSIIIHMMIQLQIPSSNFANKNNYQWIAFHLKDLFHDYYLSQLFQNTTFILQMSIQSLKKAYQSLSPASDVFLQVNNNAIRSKDSNGRLQRAFFATIAYLILKVNPNISKPIILIVTASHNPPGDNGLKIDTLSQHLKLNEKEMQIIINNEHKFIQFIRESYVILKSKKKIDFILGRDKRPSSVRLSQIIEQVIEHFQLKCVNLQERSTPQIFSLGEFIYENNNQSYQQSISLYYNIIEYSFRSSIQLLRIHLKRQIKIKTICLDFANGVGGLTMINYAFLKDYFQINITHSNQFQKPNVNCGAQWINQYYKQNLKCPDLTAYPIASEYFFFDGDSDRIIVKLQQQQQIIDGDDLNSMITTLVLQLVSSLDLHKVRFISVGNITSNEGLRQYVNSLKIEFKKVPVGIKNLYNEAKLYDIGCLFESNGHGSLYFSAQILKKIQQKSADFWQAKLLLNLHQICRNNPRGYALHIFLIYELYLIYFGEMKNPLFKKMQMVKKDYEILNIQFFENEQSHRKVLIKPHQLVLKLQQIQNHYKQCQILVRKSHTQPILRLSIQGRKQQLLNQVYQEVDKVITECINEIFFLKK